MTAKSPERSKTSSPSSNNSDMRNSLFLKGAAVDLETRLETIKVVITDVPTAEKSRTGQWTGEGVSVRGGMVFMRVEAFGEQPQNVLQNSPGCREADSLTDVSATICLPFSSSVWFLG